MLAARLIFLPIAVPNCFENPRYSPGMNYIKNMIAECLQGGMYLLIIIIASWYESVAMNVMTEFSFSSLFMPFMLLTALAGSKTITMAIVDAVL